MNLVKQITLIASAIGCLAIGGCASGQSIKDSKEAAAAVPSGKGRIVVYRTGMLGTAVQPAVSVDGAKKGTCKPNGAFYADVAPGNRVVSAATEVKRETLVHVEEGKSSYVRCSIGLGMFVGQPYLEVIAPGTGKLEAEKLVFTGRH